MWRSIGTGIVRTLYLWATSSISGPGDDSTSTSYFRPNSGSIPETKPMDWDTVQALMIFCMVMI